MPHLRIEYSSNLDQSVDIGDFCQCLAREIANIGLYPLGGIRVRAYAAQHYALADMHANNQFVDLVFRIGAGRSSDDKEKTGKRLMALAEQYFSERLSTGYFMLSLEIIEIESGFSWKRNSVHKRLNTATL